jgi:DNA modification methylase
MTYDELLQKLQEAETKIVKLEAEKRRVGVAFRRIPETGKQIHHMLQKDFPYFEYKAGNSYIPENDTNGSVTLIEADNLSALIALQNTHKNKVDVIYIDPPYNTGNNDFIYHDARSSSLADIKGADVNDYEKTLDGRVRSVKKNNPEFHSLWLSFMEKRLFLAKELLKDTGVIICAIGDDEQPRLRLLMGDIFGEENFVTNVIWQGSPSSLSKFTSGGVDYMIMFAKNASKQKPWRKEKPYAREMLQIVEDEMSSHGDKEKASLRLKKFIASKRDIEKGLASYNQIDDQGRVHASSNLDNALYRPNLIYPVTDPKTGRVYEPPEKGWKLSQETMDELIGQGLVIFGDRKFPRKKLLLSEYLYALPPQSFKAERSAGNTQLVNILGKGKFNFPKNTQVIKEWIYSINSDKDAVILDFFAGSGTTGHAVAELNKEDGGNRQCILITHGNENGKNIAEDVTAERMKRVLSGVNWDDKKIHEPLPGRFNYYELKFCDTDKGDIEKALAGYIALSEEVSYENIQMHSDSFTVMSSETKIVCSMVTSLKTQDELDEVEGMLNAIHSNSLENQETKALIVYGVKDNLAELNIPGWIKKVLPYDYVESYGNTVDKLIELKLL